MLIRYIGHASIAIETAGIRILCDPWWSGPAYTGQWYPYPLPAPAPADAAPDYVYLSHAHEDHLHVPTLSTIQRSATLLIPRFPDTGLRDFLRSLGFRRVVELGHGQTRQLAPGVECTLYINKDDSLLVLQSGGRTLVNGNDALHASARHVIDHFCEQIVARHGRADTLLLGYGGASWFPNCMQLTDAPAYDAVQREHVFAQNFAYIARQLGARMALPFAASFVLLEDRLRWINRARHLSPSPGEELRQQGAAHIRTHVLMPGDRIVGDEIVEAPARWPLRGSVDSDIDRTYAAEIAALRQPAAMDEGRMTRIVAALAANARARAPQLLRGGQRLQCRIDVTDLPADSIHVDCAVGATRVERCDRLRLAPLVLSTRLAVLEAWATQEYGYESLSIGYGGFLHSTRRDMPLRNALLAVLGRKPLPPSRAQRSLNTLRHPLRTFDLWRRDLHWQRLAMRLRTGDVQRWNDIYSADPERWSPIRTEPLPMRRSA
jgi:L-ascorbate metabolism protein UlaG (beta-lactamase superfamily)